MGILTRSEGSNPGFPPLIKINYIHYLKIFGTSSYENYLSSIIYHHTSLALIVCQTLYHSGHQR